MGRPRGNSRGFSFYHLRQRSTRMRQLTRDLQQEQDGMPSVICYSRLRPPLLVLGSSAGKTHAANESHRHVSGLPDCDGNRGD